jgi:hypothetical protein
MDCVQETTQRSKHIPIFDHSASKAMTRCCGRPGGGRYLHRSWAISHVRRVAELAAVQGMFPVPTVSDGTES